MSNRELDNLFKNKLEELERKPSAGAWDKIQAGSKKKTGKNVRFYMSIAAAVALLITSSVIFLPDNTIENKTTDITLQDEKTDQIKESTYPKEKELLTNKENHISGKEKDQPAQSAEPESNRQLAVDNSGSSKNSNDVVQSEKKDALLKKSTTPTTEGHDNMLTKATKLPEQEVANSERETVTRELNIVPDATTTTATASKVQEDESQGQTLTFNIEDFNTSTAVANTEEGIEKKSTLKKVLSFAKNIKESDAGLGELREAKNEIFALNFNKENDNSK